MACDALLNAQGDSLRRQYLFASRGINPSNLKSQISAISSASHGIPGPGPAGPTAASTWAPPIPLADTDIDGYRQWRHETIIVSAIEENRRRTQRAIQQDLRALMADDWKRQRAALLEELAAYDEDAGMDAGAGPGTARLVGEEGTAQRRRGAQSPSCKVTPR